MAEITQDSYVETDLHQQVITQKGRDVCDYELNESGKLLRVLLYRMGKTLGGDGVESGIRIVSTGVANQLQVAVGVLNAAGYRKSVLTPVTITGLTTPISERTDILYARFRETEVDDPHPLTELGSLSRRTVLTVSFAVVQDPGTVPATTGMPWEGGDYYLPLATIHRPIGQAIILNSDITQVYELLPDASLAQMAVYLNGYVDRLIAGRHSIIESSAATPGSFTIDVNPGGAYSFSDYVEVRFGRGHADEHSVFIGSNSQVIFGAPTGTKNPLTIQDSVGGVDIPWSDDSPGSEQDAGSKLFDGLGRSVTTITPQRSLLRAVNGRAMASIGDGVSTFGDFNGSTAFVEVVAAAQAIPATSLHIYVKQGTYDLPTTIFLSGMDTVIEGVDQSECKLRNTHATQTGIETNSRLQIKRISFTRSSTATRAIQAANLIMEDVSVTNLSVKMIGGTGARVWDRVSLTGAGILVDLGAEDGRGSLLIRDSSLISTATGLPVIYSVTTGGGIGSVVLERCSVTTGTGTDYTAESGIVDIESSFAPTTAGSRYLLRFKFRDCYFKTASAPNCFQVGRHVLPYVEFSSCVFTTTAKNLMATQLPVFRPRALNVVIKDCEFDLQEVCSSFVGGNEGGAIDLYATEKLTVRNISVRKTYGPQFDDTVVSTAGLAVVMVSAGQSIDVDGVTFTLKGIAYAGATLPRQMLHVQSQFGTDTLHAAIRNVVHEPILGAVASPVVTQAYIRVAGRFGKCRVEGCALQFASATHMPVATAGVLIGGPSGDSLTDGDEVEVVDSSFSTITGFGVLDQSTSRGTNSVRGCRFVNCGTYTGGTSYSIAALDQTSVAAFSVTGNTVSDSPSVGIYVERKETVVSGNRTFNVNTLGGGGYAGISFKHTGAFSIHCYGNSCFDNANGYADINVWPVGLGGVLNRSIHFGFDTRQDGAGVDIFTVGTFANAKPMQFNRANIAIF